MQSLFDRSQRSKRGVVKMDSSIIGSAFFGIIALVVLFIAVAELLPEYQDAAQDINDTGAPLTGLFASDGIMVLLLVAAVVLAVLAAVGFGGRRR